MKIKSALLISLLAAFLCSCDNNTIPDSEPQSVTNAGISTGAIADKPSKLTVEDITNFKLLRSNWTEAQMSEEGFKREDALSGERKYYNESISYSYGNPYGNNTTPDLLDVYGKLDVDGPKGISIGDTFHDVLDKFPHEKDWEKSENGEFYGQLKKDEFIATGFVTTDGNKKEIIVWPQESLPRLVIFFEDNVVTHYTIYLQNIFD